ncbi:hypothetical protein Tco_1527564 [Tanacetum coccineum]
MLNELANDGVNLSKHEINVGFVNSLPEKWLTFSQGLRNANHTQTLDLADIYGRFDFQENSDDEINERSSEEYLRDLDIEYQEKALLANSKRDFARDCLSKMSEHSYKSPVNNYSSVSKGFQPKFTPKLIQSSSNSNSQADPNKLPNFNTRRILVPKSQDVNKSLESTKTLNTPESSKDSEAESLTPLPPLKNLQGASPSSEVMPLIFQPHSSKEKPGLVKLSKPHLQFLLKSKTLNKN